MQRAPTTRARLAALALPLLTGAEAGGDFGAALALGDCDGDGYADLVIGAPGALGGRGRVTLHRGSPEGFSPTPDFTLEGTQSGERLGATIAYAGDLDGDGLADFAVAAPDHDRGEGADHGRVLALYGRAEAPWLAVSEVAVGPPGSHLGATLAGPGDLDGDGLSELLIGAPDAGGGAGLVLMHRGGEAAVLPTAAWSLTGAPGERLGAHLAPAWDVDGDGHADLLVGGDHATTLYFGQPAADPSPPVDPTRSTTLPPATVAVGDVDGDRRSDLRVDTLPLGDPTGDGVPDAGVFIADLGLVIEDDATGARHPTLPCFCTPASAWGAALAVGDLDGDGVTDLALGAPLFPIDGQPAGAVFTYLSRPERALAVRASFPAPIHPNALPATALGDLDDDGFDEVLVPSADGLVLAYGHAPGEAPRHTFLELPALTAHLELELAAHDLHAASAADLDADGRHDLVLALRTDARSGVLVLWGDGRPAWATLADVATGLGAWIEVGDLDDDGVPDLLVGADADLGRPSAALFRGHPAGLADSPALIDRGPALGAGAPRYLVAGDLDGRAGANLLTATTEALAVLAALDGALPPEGVRLPLDAPLLALPTRAGDLDGDGLDDLLYLDPAHPAVVLPGRADHPPLGPARPLPEAPAALVPIGDFDGDGRMDLLGADLVLRLGPELAPGPSLSASLSLSHSSLSLSLSPEQPAPRLAPAGDVDGDGRADLLLTDRDGTRLLCAPEASRLTLAARARDLGGDHTLLPEVGTRVPGRFRVEAWPVSLSGLADHRVELAYASPGATETRLAGAFSDEAHAPLALPVTTTKLREGQPLRWRLRLRERLARAPLQPVSPWVRDDLGPRAGTFKVRPSPPVEAFPDRYPIDQDSARFVPAPGVLGNDLGPTLYEASAPLTVDTTPVEAPTRGRLTLFSNGSFSYAPDPGAWGEDRFVYRANDDTGQSATAEVVLAIRPLGMCFGADPEACRVARVSTSLRRLDGSVLTLDCAPEGGVLRCAPASSPCPPAP